MYWKAIIAIVTPLYSLITPPVWARLEYGWPCPCGLQGQRVATWPFLPLPPDSQRPPDGHPAAYDSGRCCRTYIVTSLGMATGNQGRECNGVQRAALVRQDGVTVAGRTVVPLLPPSGDKSLRPPFGKRIHTRVPPSRPPPGKLSPILTWGSLGSELWNSVLASRLPVLDDLLFAATGQAVLAVE